MTSPELNDFYRHIRADRNIFLLKTSGSQSYNLATPDSDHDFLGVFVNPVNSLFGLRQPRDHYDGKDPDFQIHEIGKFANLLVKGNPNLVEIMFGRTENYIIPIEWEDYWRELYENREILLNARTVRQYLGYAKGQYQRLTKGQSLHTTGGQFNTKWAYHIIRLLLNAAQIAEGEHPTVWWDGPQRDNLMNIRRGLLDQQTIEIMMNSIIEHIDGIKPWSIPDEPDEAWINA